MHRFVVKLVETRRREGERKTMKLKRKKTEISMEQIAGNVQQKERPLKTQTEGEREIVCEWHQLN